MSDENDLLIEQVTSAHRTIDPSGSVRAHPAWHDLDDVGRAAAFEATARQRLLETALDPAGLSGTARAVLAKLKGTT
jgi:hypothetical protein